MKFTLAGKKEDDEELEWGLKLLINGDVTLTCKKKNGIALWNILTIYADTGVMYLHKNISSELGLRLGKGNRMYITDFYL